MHIVDEMILSLPVTSNLFIDTVEIDCAKIIFDFTVASCISRILIMPDMILKIFWVIRLKYLYEIISDYHIIDYKGRNIYMK